MLYELLSPSIELEIDRALDCSPVSVSTANPILRRLGVAGGGSDRHFNAQSVWTAVPNKSTGPSTEAEAQAATQAVGGREPLEPEGPLSLRGSIFFFKCAQ